MAKTYTINDIYHFLGSLADGMESAAIFIVSPDGKFQLARGDVLRKANVDSADIEGQYYQEYLAQFPNAPELIESYTKILQGKWHNTTIEDKNREYRISFWPLFERSGELLAGIALVRDVTDRKKTERDLKRTAEELMNFTRAAAHDLKEPSRTIYNYVQLIEEEAGFDTEPLTGWFQFVKDAAARSGKLIDALLQYSLATTKTLQWSEVDVGALINGVLTDLGILLEESGAKVKIGEMPKLQASDMLPNVFLNLISNAVKYRQEGGRPEIEITAKKCPPSHWLFCVEDNGAGIPKEFHETVFEAFRRLDGTRSGVGLGLALTRRIVEGHGGKIWLESREGQGTKVYFTLAEG